jgi:uncharacterized protein (DUF885 family)
MLMSRRHAMAALGSTMLMPIVAGAAFGAAQSAADKAFAKLAAIWLDQSMKFSPVSATGIGDHRFDAMLDNVSAAGRNAGLVFAKQTLGALQAIDIRKLSRANQVDAALLSNELRGQIWRTESVQDWAWNPLGYQAIAGGAIYTLMAREFAPVETRLLAATQRLEAIPAFLKQVRGELQLARIPVPHAATYSAQHKGLKSIIGEMIDPHKGKLSGAARTRLDAAIAAYNAACDEHQAWIDGTLVPAAQADYRAGAERFDKQLTFTLQSTLTRGDIRARAEAAMAKCRADMYAVARQALAGRAGAPETPDNPSPEQQQRAIKAALELSAAERPAREKLVEDATAAVEVARKFVAERDLITLPAGPVKVILMPEFQRGFSVAYCDSPGPLDKNLDTFYAVSPIPAEWTNEQTTSFLREYNTRGILDLGVHEAMPGHYVQIFHSNSYPSVLRAILSSGSFVEGWAVYAQEMMVAEGFQGGDPLYKLQQLKMLLRSITNAIIDQAIHVDGMTQAEMMKFLTEGAFQEEREAAGKWRRAQLSVTQLSTYFVGYAEHVEARAAAEKKAGAGFKLKAYHDKVLSYGSPPMRYARALMFGEAIG